LISGFRVFAGFAGGLIAVVLLSPKVGIVPFRIFCGLGNTGGLHARAPDIFVLGQDWQVQQTEVAPEKIKSR
jgi:hypothetical protein